VSPDLLSRRSPLIYHDNPPLFPLTCGDTPPLFPLTDLSSRRSRVTRIVRVSLLWSECECETPVLLVTALLLMSRCYFLHGLQVLRSDKVPLRLSRAWPPGPCTRTYTHTQYWTHHIKIQQQSSTWTKFKTASALMIVTQLWCWQSKHVLARSSLMPQPHPSWVSSSHSADSPPLCLFCSFLSHVLPMSPLTPTPSSCVQAV
jgi:hypothetical protein